MESGLSKTQGRDETLPLLRILALSGPTADQVVGAGGVLPVSLVGLMLKKGDKDIVCMIPTLAREGHVSLVRAASTLDDFHKIRQDVSARFAKRLSALHLHEVHVANFLVVGFTRAFSEDPSRMFLVYDTLVSPEPIWELNDVYKHLESVTDYESGSEVEHYFADDAKKQWVNEFIARLERILNWPKFVAEGTERMNK